MMTLISHRLRLFAAFLSALLFMGLSVDAAAGRWANLDDQAIEDLVTEYYNTRSEWAGTFSLISVQQIRAEKAGQGRRNVHVAYKYAAIPGNRAGRRDKGYDQRVFTFEKRGPNWAVVRMGGHMSAHF